MGDRRIIAGTLGGRRLLALPANVTGVRPTSDRVREAIFSRLHDRVQGATVLDLYAGSGALGIEALSRGAESVVAVERNAKVVRFLRRQIDALGLASRMTVVERDVARWGPAPSDRGFDLVFADPPYTEAHTFAGVLDALFAARLLSDDAVVVFERPRNAERDTVPPAGFTASAPRRYGDTCVEWWQRAL